MEGFLLSIGRFTFAAVKYLFLIAGLFLTSLQGFAQESMQTDSAIQDTLVIREISIPLEIRVSCEQEKYQIAWTLNHIDSVDLPKQLKFKGFRYEDEDTTRIPYKTQNIDSSTLFGLPYIWIKSPGYYWLEGVDSAKRIHYSSDKVRIDLCAMFQLPERFQLSTGKTYQPQYSQNIQKIELVIFDAQGNEVYKSKNPHFKWDGRNQNTTEQCAPGTYFYHCDVWEIHGTEVQKKNVTGIIEIIL